MADPNKYTKSIPRQRQAAKFFVDHSGLELIDSLQETYWRTVEESRGHTKALRLELIDEVLTKNSALSDLKAMIMNLAREGE